MVALAVAVTSLPLMLVPPAGLAVAVAALILSAGAFARSIGSRGARRQRILAAGAAITALSGITILTLSAYALLTPRPHPSPPNAERLYGQPNCQR